jgi:hypothetical protein
MDKYYRFTSLFDIQRNWNQADENNYERQLNKFKTLFPRYVLYNEQIQHAINEASGNYESLTSADRMPSNQQHHMSSGSSGRSEDGFNFSEDDTYATVSMTKYTQNEPVYTQSHNFDTTMDDHRNQHKVVVRHCLKVDKIRLLVSKKILELLHHHVISQLTFKKYRSRHYADKVQKS